MAVKIVSGSAAVACADDDYLRVSTCSDPFDDTVTLATIERVVVKQDTSRTPEPAHVKTLVLRQPMSRDQALGLATCYAKRKRIPLIYKA